MPGERAGFGRKSEPKSALDRRIRLLPYQTSPVAPGLVWLGDVAWAPVLGCHTNAHALQTHTEVHVGH